MATLRSPTGIGTYADALRLSEPIELSSGCPILTIESLIQAKEAVGRPHDLQTAGLLRIIQQKRLRGH